MLLFLSTPSKLHMVLYDTPYHDNFVVLIKNYICITAMESQQSPSLTSQVS